MPLPQITDSLRKAYAEALRTYGERPQISAVDIGFVYEGGRRTERLGVRVHVRGTRAKSAAALVEELRRLPPPVGGEPLHFMEGVYRAHRGTAQPMVLPVAGPRRSVVDPLRPGVSVSHARMSGGTLGLIVFDVATGRACALGNAHVLAGPQDAVPGDPIVQPARDAGGRAQRHTIGTLERTLDDADGDAAIALLGPARRCALEQFETNVVVATPREVRIGEVVAKSGARTGMTRGIVDGTGRYYLPAARGARLRGMDGFKIVSEKDGNPDRLPLSGEGDSGAVWYATDSHAGLGLHVAGELSPDPQQEHAIACHLERVLKRLDVTVTPPASPPPPAGPGGLPFDAAYRVGRGDADAPRQAPPATSPRAFSVVRPLDEDLHVTLADAIARLTRLLERLLDETVHPRRTP